MKDAVRWYNSQQKGLGSKCKDEIKKIALSISLNPYLASVKYENVRTVACKAFPYTIHFEIEEDESMVRIISIFHFSRKPGWLEND